MYQLQTDGTSHGVPSQNYGFRSVIESVQNSGLKIWPFRGTQSVAFIGGIRRFAILAVRNEQAGHPHPLCDTHHTYAFITLGAASVHGNQPCVVVGRVLGRWDKPCRSQAIIDRNLDVLINIASLLGSRPDKACPTSPSRPG